MLLYSKIYCTMEQYEDAEKDNSDVSDSELEEAKTYLEDEPSEYYYSDCSDEE